MNREFLKTAGVPDEAIDRIMAEYGKDIQAEKDKAAETSAQLETYKAQVAELEKAAGDNAALKQQFDELKAAVEAEKKAAADKAADEQMTSVIRSAFPADKKFVNEYTEQALITQIKAELAKPENKGKGVSEIFTALTNDKAGIFENPNKLGPMPGMGGGLDDDAVVDAKMRAIMGLAAKKE